MIYDYVQVLVFPTPQRRAKFYYLAYFYLTTKLTNKQVGF